MIPYFPFESDTFAMTVGARALHDAPLIEVDLPRYRSELALKAAILASDHGYYVQALPGTELAQWEALALVLRDMARHHPEHFGLRERGDRWTWRNRLLDDETTFTFGDPATLPHAPLDWAGRQVQEDLILMSADAAAGNPLVAGQLCFAAGWCLGDKLGKSYLAVHHEVPIFAERVGRPSQLLMERLKPERPVWRVNWSVRTSDQLNAAPRFRAEQEATKQGITAENAGERCWLRIERQGLARLQHSGAVLFTIHTYQSQVAEVAQHAEHAQRMLGVLRTTPAELLAYKGMTPYADALCGYLAQLVYPRIGSPAA